MELVGLKKCKKCNLEKDFNLFNKNKTNKGGFKDICRVCSKKEYYTYSKTFLGKVNILYNNQKSHSKKRGHKPPEYSKEEFLKYCTNSEKFKNLYKEWVESGFNKWKAPSIDRIYDYKGYSFNNIRICTWKENSNKGSKSNFLSKAILQFDLNGNFIKEWVSINSAYRSKKGTVKGIINCCKGIGYHSGGFRWKYKIN